jgi:hypothetical protein
MKVYACQNHGGLNLTNFTNRLESKGGPELVERSGEKTQLSSAPFSTCTLFIGLLLEIANFATPWKSHAQCFRTA